MLRAEIGTRLGYLCEVGVGYLTLDRSTRTLSGGEVQRVNLTTCLGASLVNTLFVMDEPSVGLHPRDVGRLVRVMHNLRDKGNTLLVVEHEEAIIRAADICSTSVPAAANAAANWFTGPAGRISGERGHPDRQCHARRATRRLEENFATARAQSPSGRGRPHSQSNGESRATTPIPHARLPHRQEIDSDSKGPPRLISARSRSKVPLSTISRTSMSRFR